MSQRDLPDLVSESQALRRMDLPASPHWRAFLRGKLPSTSTGTGNLYDRFAVEELAERLGDFVRATNPPEVRNVTPATKRSNRADGLTDRRGPSIKTT